MKIKWTIWSVWSCIQSSKSNSFGNNPYDEIMLQWQIYWRILSETSHSGAVLIFTSRDLHEIACMIRWWYNDKFTDSCCQSETSESEAVATEPIPPPQARVTETQLCSMWRLHSCFKPIMTNATSNLKIVMKTPCHEIM